MIRQNISALTKAGLQRARERGVVLGNPRMREVRAMGTAAAAERRNAKRDALTLVIGELRAAGIRNHGDIADELNRRGLVTVTGKPWTARRVSDFDYNCKRVS